MPDLEVEVMLENHPHLFIVEIESVLEVPRVGSYVKCGKCNFHGVIARVGTPGRKQRKLHPPSDKQTSMFDKE